MIGDPGLAKQTEEYLPAVDTKEPASSFSAFASNALSEGQKGLWSLQKRFPASTAYNIPLCLRIRGPMDAGALENALRTVIERHPVLSCVIDESDGTPRCASAQLPNPLLVDVQVAAPEALARAAELAKQPFVLHEGPLLRAHLLTYAHDEALLLFVIHHI